MSDHGHDVHVLSSRFRDILTKIALAYLDGRNGRDHMMRALIELQEFCSWADIREPELPADIKAQLRNVSAMEKT